MARTDFGDDSTLFVPGRAVITVDRYTAFVRFPYDADLVAAFKNRYPGRKWVPESKAWEIPGSMVKDCAEWLNRKVSHCEIIEVEDDTDWVTLIFDVVPNAHRQSLYRVLSRAFHPDTGGDTETMKRINEAYNNKHP